MVEELSPEEVAAKLEDGGAQVVDIRDGRSYREGHIPGADHLPGARFAADVDEVDWEEDVVLVCHIGESSVKAGRLLESYEGLPEGADVASMAGGYESWDGDLETESGEGNGEGNGDADAEPDAPF